MHFEFCFYRCEDSDVNGRAEKIAVARTCVPTMDGTKARRKKVMCDTPAGLPVTPSFSVHVVLFLSNHFKHLSLFEKGRYMTFVKWSNN